MADASIGGADAASGDAGEQPLACPPVVTPDDACGGDITGDWRYIGVCGLPKALTDFQRGCPAATVTKNDHVMTGTVGWGADSNYGWHLRDDYDVALQV